MDVVNTDVRGAAGHRGNRAERPGQLLRGFLPDAVVWAAGSPSTCSPRPSARTSTPTSGQGWREWGPPRTWTSSTAAWRPSTPSPRRKQTRTSTGTRTWTADTDGGVPDAVRLLEELDGEFETLLETEDIVALNAAWLRSQADLLVLDDEELDRHITERVARIPNLAERQAEAAEDELLDTPEFEMIIRELCAVAGHTLLKITMGDPNYEHDGQTALAWHFTTDQGEFLMLDDEQEAVMIHPDTKEILAAVEFEDARTAEPAVPAAGIAADCPALVPGGGGDHVTGRSHEIPDAADALARDVPGGQILGVVVHGHPVDGQLLLAIGGGNGAHGAGDAVDRWGVGAARTGGHASRQPPVQALVPESLTSFV